MANPNNEALYEAELVRDRGIIRAETVYTDRKRSAVASILIGLVMIAAAGAIIVLYAAYLWIGCVCAVIGLFSLLSKWIGRALRVSVNMRQDNDCIEHTPFVYKFGASWVRVYRNDKRYMTISDYKQITDFKKDTDYFYIGAGEDKLLVVPKESFTVGNPTDFEEYVTDKTALQCDRL